MSMTLFDIFYQHKWHERPQDAYHETMAEMEVCATDYAKDLKDVGDKWKWVIENETRDLCRPNHYSVRLSGEKKKWHDLVVSDFLLYIKKVMQHYGFDFKELPRKIQALYDIEYYGAKYKTKATKQPIKGNDGELAGSGNKTRPEPTAKAVEKETLPTIYDDEENKAREQQVFFNAIKGGWMELKGSTYSWKMNRCYLALMCGLLYWGDKVKDDHCKTDSVGDYTKFLSKSEHRFKYKSGEVTKTSKDIQKLFGGVNVSNLRSQLKELPDLYDSIVRLFPTQIKTG